MRKLAFLLVAILVITYAGCVVPAGAAENPPEIGQIYLYGELHGIPEIKQQELELWKQHYQDGMRDFFDESAYYTAAFLNLWMHADNDDILDQLYQDWDGTAAHTQTEYDYYRQIKQDCPETVFHGVDVGHQYYSTGQRYLAYLQENGYDESSTEYQLTKEAIEQGQTYYAQEDEVYRENKMAENFLREYSTVYGADVMGVFGAAHTGIHAMDYSGTVPCMANQLSKYYGGALHTEDLSSLAPPPVEYIFIVIFLAWFLLIAVLYLYRKKSKRKN